MTKICSLILLCGCLVVSACFVGCDTATPPAPPKKIVSPAVANKPAADPTIGEPSVDPTPDSPPAPPPTDDGAATEPAATRPAGKIMLGSPELTAGIPGEGSLSEADIQAWLDDPQNHEPLDFELPLGLAAGASQVKGLEANPLTKAKIELGRQLYFDTRISADNSVSCASCHHPDEGWARHTQFGVGIKEQQGGRNSPVSFNRILSDLQFWDGRAGSLEDQAIGPIANAIEMGNTHEQCVECIRGIPGYKMQFEKIFGELTIERVGQALATFERAVVTGPSPFDYYEVLKAFLAQDLETLKEDDPDLYAEYVKAKEASDANPISESGIRGRDLFFSDKAKCTACHVGANLTDEKYHNIGVGMQAEKPDLGRFEVTKEDKDIGAFKTPTIRNVAQTAPYMHDGSQKTLEEVVDFYAKGGHPNEHLDEKIKKLELTDQDKKDLVEFMKACTGDFPPVNTVRLPE